MNLMRWGFGEAPNRFRAKINNFLIGIDGARSRQHHLARAESVEGTQAKFPFWVMPPKLSSAMA
jgi:hypothetical protein